MTNKEKFKRDLFSLVLELADKYFPEQSTSTPPAPAEPVPPKPTPETFKRMEILSGVSDSYPGELWIKVPARLVGSTVTVNGQLATQKYREKVYYHIPGSPESRSGETVIASMPDGTRYLAKLPTVAASDSQGAGGGQTFTAYSYAGPSNGGRPTWRIRGRMRSGMKFRCVAGGVSFSGTVGPRKGGIGWSDRTGQFVVKNSDHNGAIAVLIPSKYNTRRYRSDECKITFL